MSVASPSCSLTPINLETVPAFWVRQTAPERKYCPRRDRSSTQRSSRQPTGIRPSTRNMMLWADALTALHAIVLPIKFFLLDCVIWTNRSSQEATRISLRLSFAPRLTGRLCCTSRYKSLRRATIFDVVGMLLLRILLHSAG